MKSGYGIDHGLVNNDAPEDIHAFLYIHISSPTTQATHPSLYIYIVRSFHL